MRVAAFGRTEVLYKSILALEDAGHEVVFVATCEAEPEYEADVEDFRSLAADLDASFLLTEDINDPDSVGALKRTDPDVGVSVNWKTLVRSIVRNAAGRGVINCHAGDLPRYRGNAAPNWAILQDEGEVVVTLHFMDEGLDSGPILAKRSLPLTPETHIGDVYEFSRDVAPELFVEAIDGLESGTVEPTPQPSDPGEALRCYPRIPADSRIEWARSASFLARLIRASSEPLPGAYTYLNRERLTVWRAHVDLPETGVLGTPGQVARRRPDVGEVAVLTGDGFLVLEEIQLGEGDRRAATEVIKSHRTRLGMNIPDELARLANEVAKLRARLDGPEGHSQSRRE